MRTVWLMAVLLGACAGAKKVGSSPQALAPAPSPPSSSDRQAPIPKADQTFVDTHHGFQIAKPNTSWDFRSGDELSTESIEIPVVVASPEKNAQVVVQVAPNVATPTQFAERLTSGLQERAGFQTGEVVPIPMAEGAVGFDFAVENEVRGRVAILEGADNTVFVLLATWPLDAPEGVEREVRQIFDSMKAAQGAPVGP